MSTLQTRSFPMRTAPTLIAVATACLIAGPSWAVQLPSTTFSLVANPSILNCLARFPGDPDPKHAPTATVKVQEGKLNDKLTIKLKNIKPGLAFDLFTVQRSRFLANGTLDPGFTNFGLAWYQSDLEVGKSGGGKATIQTILLNQIFGFDPDASLDPTNTFHVGFWFNDPNDAAACGFNPANPTPFNGEHNAGPLAMESVPDATSGLGPLCLNPDTSTIPAHCNP